MTKTWVALGCNAVRDYNFLVPFSALLWRERIGFEPIVLRCDEWLAEKRPAVAARALDDLGIIQAILNPLERYASHTLAQNCREFAACLDLPAGDWLMPSDADLWPIMASFYQKHQGGPKATSYYANGDNYSTLPTCHVAMKVGTWRQLYDLHAGDNITTRVQALLDGWLPGYRERWPWTDKAFATWMSDQAILSEKVWTLPAEEVQCIERAGHPPVDRIDRCQWRPFKPGDVDAHLLRAPDEPANWPRVLELFSRLLPDYHDWAVDYHRKYWESYR